MTLAAFQLPRLWALVVVAVFLGADVTRAALWNKHKPSRSTGAHQEEQQQDAAHLRIPSDRRQLKGKKKSSSDYYHNDDCVPLHYYHHSKSGGKMSSSKKSSSGKKSAYHRTLYTEDEEDNNMEAALLQQRYANVYNNLANDEDDDDTLIWSNNQQRKLGTKKSSGKKGSKRSSKSGYSYHSSAAPSFFCSEVPSLSPSEVPSNLPSNLPSEVPTSLFEGLIGPEPVFTTESNNDPNEVVAIKTLGCYLEGNCVYSHNAELADSYLEKDECVWQIPSTGATLRVDHFHLDTSDVLGIDTTQEIYTGYGDGLDGQFVEGGTLLTFMTNGDANVYSGFKICFT